MKHTSTVADRAAAARLLSEQARADALTQAGNTMRAAMDVAGMTHAELAGAVGASVGHVHNVGGGRRPCSRDLAIRIADALADRGATVLPTAIMAEAILAGEVPA